MFTNAATRAGRSAVPNGLTRLAQYITQSSLESAHTIYGIPQNYTDIELTVIGRGTASGPQVNFTITANGIGGSSYSSQRTFINITTTGTSENLATAAWGTSSTLFAVGGSTSPANTTGFNRIRIFNYASATFYKNAEISLRAVNNSGTDASLTLSATAQLDSIQPINSLTMSMLSGNFAAGCIFTLWGYP